MCFDTAIIGLDRGILVGIRSLHCYQDIATVESTVACKIRFSATIVVATIVATIVVEISLKSHFDATLLNPTRLTAIRVAKENEN